MNKIMTQVFFNAVLIASLILPNISFAKDCKKGEGLWLKVSGEAVCKRCPKEEEIVSGKALKLPLGCKAPIYGAFLEIEFYTFLKSQNAYALELEKFKDNLTPSLESLSEQLKQSIQLIDQANQRRTEVLTLLETVKTENTELSTKSKFFMYSTIGLGVGLTLLTVAHFQFNH